MCSVTGLLKNFWYRKHCIQVYDVLITSCSKFAASVSVQLFNFCSRTSTLFRSRSSSMSLTTNSRGTNSRETEPDNTFWVNSVSFRIAWLHVWPGGSFLRKRNKWNLPQEKCVHRIHLNTDKCMIHRNCWIEIAVFATANLWSLNLLMLINYDI